MAKCYLETELGIIELRATDVALTSVIFTDQDVNQENEMNEVLLLAKTQIEEYLSGKRMTFDIPIHYHGTAFREKVWEELQRIPYGTTITYQELADRIGNKKAVRAVGGANHHNPLPIIIPCHRVIGKNQQLVGYGGGLWRKEKILQLEHRL